MCLWWMVGPNGVLVAARSSKLLAVLMELRVVGLLYDPSWEVEPRFCRLWPHRPPGCGLERACAPLKVCHLWRLEP